MFFQMILVLAVLLFLALVAGGYDLGLYIGPAYLFAAFVASPLLSCALVVGLAGFVDWIECRARARRRAKAVARRMVSSANHK